MTRSHRTAAAPGHRSRRSSADVENGILVATLEVLDEVGFEDLTVEAVAARAGSAKTGVYRRWPSKVPLVVEALVRPAPAPHAPDTGDLRQDMLGLWKSVANQAARSIERLLPLVTTYLGDDPELTAAATGPVLRATAPGWADDHRACGRPGRDQSRSGPGPGARPAVRPACLPVPARPPA